MTHPVPILLLGLGCSVSFGQSVSVGTPLRGDALQFGIVDCFGQGKVHASRLMGTVFDPTGVPVPGAKILLTAADKYLEPQAEPALQATTDQAGRFSLKANAGNYVFEVETPSFVGPQVEIDVGSDLVSFIHPESLYVMLGLSGSFCPWVTTSRRAFEREAQLNKKTLRAIAQKTAAPS